MMAGRVGGNQTKEFLGGGGGSRGRDLLKINQTQNIFHYCSRFRKFIFITLNCRECRGGGGEGLRLVFSS